MLTLIVVTFIATFAFKRIAAAKGYPNSRVRFYPAALCVAVLLASFFAQSFVGFAVSREMVSETSQAAASLAINVLAFACYFGALSRTLIRLKQLPDSVV